VKGLDNFANSKTQGKSFTIGLISRMEIRAPYLGIWVVSPTPGSKREAIFGQDEFSEDVNSMLTTEEPITELKQRMSRT
jgi:hypothetical protein